MRWLAFLVCAIALLGCGGGNAASRIAKAPDYAPAGQAKCTVHKSQAAPLVVEWPPAERGRLEAALRAGLVAVHYDGCEMELRPYCRVRGASYEYAPVTRKRDEVSIRNEDELYAQLPAGAARLEGKLKSAGELHVDMTLVGRWESRRGAVARAELEGECDSATHVVSAVTVGAFTFSAGASADVGGGATAFGLGGTASSNSKRETLSQDGDPSACGNATGKDTAPPDGCGALLRIEVVPVATRAERASRRGPPVEETRDRVEPPPAEVVVPPPRPTERPARPSPAPYAPVTTSGTGAAGRGPLGTVVGWTALGSIGVGTVLAVLASGTVGKYVGSSSTSGDCNTTYHYCDAAGLSAQSTTHTEALFADGFFALGGVAAVVYYLLPSQSASAQVTAAPVRGGGALGVGGRF